MGVPGDFPHGGIHPFIQTMFVTAFYGTGPAKLPINGAKVRSSRSCWGEGGLGAMETHLLSQNILVEPIVSLQPSSVL